MTLSHDQFSELQGLFLHCWAVCHEGVQSDYGFYAERLDNALVPWRLQNIVAEIAETRSSFASNLKSLIRGKGIDLNVVVVSGGQERVFT